MARKENVHIQKSIDILDIDKKTLELLISNDVKTIGDLWILTRKKLKDLGIKDSEIKQIQIKLQLLGLDLNKKVYN